MLMTTKVTIPLKGSPPPPFIVTRRDGVHAQGIVEVVVFPRIAGVQWSNTVGSTLCGMASGVVVVLPAPAGGVVVAVGRTVLQMWRGGAPCVLQVRVLHIYVHQR